MADALLRQTLLCRLVPCVMCAVCAVLLADITTSSADISISGATDAITNGAGTLFLARDDGPSSLSFEARVDLGEEAERGGNFTTYHSAMGRQTGDRLADIMRSCFASVQNPQTTTFVLVADITAEGLANAVEVKPATNIARCFASGLANVSFPLPPPFPGREGFPITIQMHIR